jgi:hypothetical protein
MCGEGFVPQRFLIVLAIDQLTVDDLLNYVRNLWVTLGVFIAGYVFMTIFLSSKEVSGVSLGLTILGLCLNIFLVVCLILYHRNPLAYRGSKSPRIGMGRDDRSIFFLSIMYPLFFSVFLLMYDIAFFIFLVVFSTWYYYFIFIIDIIGTSCTAYVLYGLKRAIEADQGRRKSPELGSSILSSAPNGNSEVISNILYKSDTMA